MGLPEFILHRMLIPNSFHFEHSRFSFEIKNTYAPGTITRLKLVSDGNDIPLDQIQYRADGQPAKLASQISPQSPAAIPTGIRINISIQASANPKKLVLWAETKEAGIIQFTVKDEHKLAMRKKLIQSFMGKPLDLSLDFDLENSKPINELLLGFTCDKDPNPIPGDTPSIHPPMLVFPPVNASIGSRWTDGIGPFSSRTMRHDLGWTPPQENNFGTDEFLQFCESNHIQPVLALDSTLTSANEAARWVSYCNDSPQSLEGKARCLNGHSAPYAVKTWIITGCAWQDWELTSISALTYARKINHFTQAMRAVDNNLKIGILVKCLISDDPANPITHWNELLLTEVGQCIDFVCWQIPILEDGFISEESPIDRPMRVQEAFHDNLERMISRMQDQISRCIQNREVRQAIDASQFLDSLDAQIRNNFPGMDQIGRNIHLLDTLKSIIKSGDSFAFLTLGARELQTSQLSPIHALLATLASGTRSSTVPLTISTISSLAGPQKDDSQLDSMLLSSSKEHQFELILANRSPWQQLRLKLNVPQFGKIRFLRSSRIPSIVNGYLPKFRKKGDFYELILPPHSITFVEFESFVWKR